MAHSDKVNRLYRLAADRAEHDLGVEVFNFQPTVIKRALIAEQILAIVNDQDETTDDATVRKLAHDLQDALNQAFAY